MKRFKDFFREQASPGMPSMGEQQPKPKIDPLTQYKEQPIHVGTDDDVITALFNNKSDVIGPTIKTSSNKIDDNKDGVVRIDLRRGTARLNLASLANGIVSLASIGHMIDDTENVRALTKRIRTRSDELGLRSIG